MPDLWNHQKRGIDDTLEAVQGGAKRVCLTSPTGGGKTAMIAWIARWYLEQGRKVVLYTNRKMLVEQTSRVLAESGMTHGVRAAGHEDHRERLLQVSSVQTEQARVLKTQKWQLHDAALAILDECHLHKGKTAKELMARHGEAGCPCVGVTATPLDMGDIYESLVVAGVTSELRRCGALVPCSHFGPDEPDLKHIGKTALGEDLTEKQNVKAMMTPTIFARVLEWFAKLNPERKPTILFAPGVRESLWFAEQFVKAGISAAHIDGEEVWINGEMQRTSKSAREAALAGSRDGSITVLCNRFVLREGIDAPWLAHGIFATVFGSLQSYLQSGGRLLRAFPGLDCVTLQDHGGNWWRHGSLNADRLWDLEYTAGVVTGLREERLRAKLEKEPFRCPRCARILFSLRCPCGFEVQPGAKSRPVVQVDGSLRPMPGDVFKPRRISRRPDGPKIWERMYFRSLKGKGVKTFRAAMALFAVENNWQYPSPTWPLMPTEIMDLFRLVPDVPRERLTGSLQPATPE